MPLVAVQTQGPLRAAPQALQLPLSPICSLSWCHGIYSVAETAQIRLGLASTSGIFYRNSTEIGGPQDEAVP